MNSDDNITQLAAHYRLGAPQLSEHTQSATSAAFLSKIKLQRKLDQPWGLSLQNLIESLRIHVAVGIMEIRVVQDVKELCPELDVL